MISNVNAINVYSQFPDGVMDSNFILYNDGNKWVWNNGDETPVCIVNIDEKTTGRFPIYAWQSQEAWPVCFKNAEHALSTARQNYLGGVIVDLYTFNKIMDGLYKITNAHQDNLPESARSEITQMWENILNGDGSKTGWAINVEKIC